VKKILALLAVFALTAVGCDDKKSTGKSTQTTGSNLERKDTVRKDVVTTVINTVHVTTAIETNLKTNVKTVEVPAKGDAPRGDTPKGPAVPPPGGDAGKDKKNDGR
jgi:hypothetical protein